MIDANPVMIVRNAMRSHLYIVVIPEIGIFLELKMWYILMKALH